MLFLHYMASALLLLFRSYQDSTDDGSIVGNDNHSATFPPILKSSNKYMFRFRSVAAPGKCMEVRGQSESNHAVVQLFQCDGSKSQKWVVTNNARQTTGGTLLSVNSFNCMSAHGGATDDGTAIHQLGCLDPIADYQKWKVVARPDFATTRQVQIIGIGSKKCLTINSGPSYENTTPIVLWECSVMAKNQLWELIR